MNSPINAYDEIPYPNLTFPRTQPIRTAAMARLFGIDAPDPRSARILELGCAAGANLLPMATELPDATFLGIDLSAKQIEEGEKIISETGLRNIDLRQEDVANIGPSLGKFDYIIAHGLFSWVPEHVQDNILRICRENLSPQGVAYVSYNVLPGWHPRRAVRDMMLYHVGLLENPKARIEQSRAILGFMASHAKTGFYSEMLGNEVESLSKCDDGYLYHEFLERDNHPILFSNFIKKAQEHQLEYLADSILAYANPGILDSKILPPLQNLSGGNHVRFEQYLDFIRNRSFRESLLVQREIKFKRALDSSQISKMWIASVSKSENAHTASLRGPQPIQFVSERGHRIQLRDPLAKTAMLVLEEQAGTPIQISELIELIHARIGIGGKLADAEKSLSNFLLEAYNYSALEFFVMPWPCVHEASETPQATPLARYQARSGELIVSLKHQAITGLNADYRQLIEWLDGKHTHDEIVGLMMQKIDINQLPSEIKQIAHDGTKLRNEVDHRVKAMLADLAKMGLLAS